VPDDSVYLLCNNTVGLDVAHMGQPSRVLVQSLSLLHGDPEVDVAEGRELHQQWEKHLFPRQPIVFMIEWL
jgi:hypothetical protein